MSTRHGWQMSNMGYQLNTPSPPPLFPRKYKTKLIVFTFQIESFQMIFYLLPYIWCNIQGFLTQNKFPQHIRKAALWEEGNRWTKFSPHLYFKRLFILLLCNLFSSDSNLSFLSLIHYQENIWQSLKILVCTFKYNSLGMVASKTLPVWHLFVCLKSFITKSRNFQK